MQREEVGAAFVQSFPAQNQGLALHYLLRQRWNLQMQGKTILGRRVLSTRSSYGIPAPLKYDYLLKYREEGYLPSGVQKSWRLVFLLRTSALYNTLPYFTLDKSRSATRAGKPSVSCWAEPRLGNEYDKIDTLIDTPIDPEGCMGFCGGS